MTKPLYTLSSIKREPSPVPGTDYMDINPDEVEAGSILLSLSQHTKQNKDTKSTTTTNTMSIRNLLGDNDDEQQNPVSGPTIRDQYQMNAHPYVTTRLSKEMHRYPETTKKKPAVSDMYMDERPHYHTHVPSTLTTPSAQQRHSESSFDWKQRHYPQQDLANYTSTNQTYPQQSYQSMKKDPKIRRNALHAYISYMTYSDLARIKSNRAYPTHSHSTQPPKQQPQQQQQQQQHNRHPHHSSSTPLSDRPSTMPHQWPLTAYLTHPGNPSSGDYHQHYQYYHSDSKNIHDKHR
ncbi:hypothetical protein BC941DRAFT_426417 [Chlamydoabsidia padenii]|nr:hypothetical protein BC941DRAFT_426417 [Chlamydoabsidia padenii]